MPRRFRGIHFSEEIAIMETAALARKGTQDIVRDGYFDLSPRNLGEAIQLAELMAKSDLIPPQFRNKPGDVLIAVQYGAEVGLKPLQAMQGIAVINGRPTIWGDAALGVVLASGLMAEYKEMTFEEIEKAQKAVFWGIRKGKAEPITREFSVKDAQTAKLWGSKDTWTKYPWRMLQMRARAFGLRDGWSDVLKGMSIREEIEDIDVPLAPTILAMPRRMSERQIDAPEPAQLTNGENASQDAPGPTNAPAPIVGDTPPCPKCRNYGMKLIHAGVSKQKPDGSGGGKPYSAFWKCTQPGCKGSVQDSDWQDERTQAQGDGDPGPDHSTAI